MRTKRGDKELDLTQRLKYENKKLKRQVKQLRKLLDRIPMELYQNVEETIEKQKAIELREQNVKKNRHLKEAWECRDCAEDSLKIFLIHRRDGTFYFRKCSTCDNRTKLQKYSNDVMGIMA